MYTYHCIAFSLLYLYILSLLAWQYCVLLCVCKSISFWFLSFFFLLFSLSEQFWFAWCLLLFNENNIRTPHLVRTINICFQDLFVSVRYISTTRSIGRILCFIARPSAEESVQVQYYTRNNIRLSIKHFIVFLWILENLI
jgi:hypothetical protein